MVIIIRTGMIRANSTTAPPRSFPRRRRAGAGISLDKPAARMFRGSAERSTANIFTTDLCSIFPSGFGNVKQGWE